MKKLYLIRHAKSSWDNPFIDDFDRPLNDRGRKDAPRMGRRLKERGIHPDLMLSSPAERAISTCRVIAGKIGYNPENIHKDSRLYHAADEQLLSVIHRLNDANDEVVIVGHNPGLTDLTNRLAGHHVTSNVPTCGVVCLKFDSDAWSAIRLGSGEVDLVDYPKNK